jgi:hypothetical protein
VNVLREEDEVVEDDYDRGSELIIELRVELCQMTHGR